MIASKQVLYNVAWQKLRVSLLGGWTTAEGTTANINRLRAYINAKASDDNEELSRLWRSLNLLNAIRMGYSGQQLTGSRQDDLVREYRDTVSKEYKALKSKAQFVVDDDAKIKSDWKALDEASKKAILGNLQKRRDLHADSPHRGELSWFLDLVKAT